MLWIWSGACRNHSILILKRFSMEFPLPAAVAGQALFRRRTLMTRPGFIGVDYFYALELSYAQPSEVFQVPESHYHRDGWSSVCSLFAQSHLVDESGNFTPCSGVIA